MNKGDYAEAMADLATAFTNAERAKELRLIARLKELGWQDFTIRERMILKNRKDENADNLYKAFEHKKMGTVFCYSEQEATAFLKQLEAHS